MITITNTRVLDFFERNPSIDPNILMLNTIDLYEFVLNSMSNTDTSSLLKHIVDNSITLNTIKDKLECNNSIMSSELSNIKTNIDKITLEISNNISNKFIDLKSQYLEELKNVLVINDFNNISKIHEKINTNNIILISGMTEVLDKNKCVQNENISLLLRSFYESLNNETRALLSTLENDNNALSSFSDTFSIKFSDLSTNVQQHIFNSESRLVNVLNELREVTSGNSISSITLHQQVSSLLDKFNNSFHKGKTSENLMFNILTKCFPSGEIVDMSSTPHSCDFSLKRIGKHDILIENKSYNRNVNPDEVNKFQDDIKMHNKCGLMLSQESGITGKLDWQIDIYNKNVMVYIHNVGYDQEKIKLGVQIIDHIFDIIKENDKDEEITISNDDVLKINMEMQKFISNRDNLLIFMRDNYNEMVIRLKNLEMPMLSNYIMKKREQDIEAESKSYKCKTCNNFICTSRKELNIHKKECK